MLRALLVPVLTTLLSASTPQEGEAWIHQAEQKLYRWPEAGAHVSFEARTDILDPLLASMRSQLVLHPDENGSKLVAALEKMRMRGTLDTRSGKLEGPLVLDCGEVDEYTKSALEPMRRRMEVTLAGCFGSLPLSDPTLLRKGASVLTAEETPDEHVVTVSGSRPGQKIVLHLARDNALPRTIELGPATMNMGYCEAAPGRFVPERIEVTPRAAPVTKSTIRWQKKDELWFPERVTLDMPGMQGMLSFEKLAVTPAAPVPK